MNKKSFESFSPKNNEKSLIEYESEKENLSAQYNELDKTRLNYEEDAGQIYKYLRGEFLSGIDNQDVDKFKKYLELDEIVISNLENDMIRLESKLGYDPDKSCRFENNKDDMLVCSAIFYNDRMSELKKKTNNTNIDETFVGAIVDYASAVEHDETSVVSMSYDDIERRQQYIQNCQLRRSRCHNNMIKEFNLLNDLARANGVKPFTYRDFVTNSIKDNYKNDEHMFHDRTTLAHYVGEVIGIINDKKLPDRKYIKET